MANMKNLRRLILVFFAALLVASISFGQKAAEKKSYVFHGKVESVDKAAKRLNVHNEPIEGWMGAMTMLYPVDDASILDKVKPGDQITATVYDGDYSLHNVKIAAGNAESKK
jgi:Cu/Ag efflux protein CusF